MKILYSFTKETVSEDLQMKYDACNTLKNAFPRSPKKKQKNL